jgi:hypothetical protein
MITCPFCQKHVLDQETMYLEDGNNVTPFYCPTYVEVAPGRRWCHYHRNVLPTGYLRYEAVIPPFVLLWYPGIKLVKVEQFKFSDPDNWNQEMLLHEHATTLEDFLHLCNRFQNLRAFS